MRSIAFVADTASVTRILQHVGSHPTWRRPHWPRHSTESQSIQLPKRTRIRLTRSAPVQ